MSDSEVVDIQCTQVKKELYKLKQCCEALSHAENRQEALRLFQVAYDDVDVLQSFISKR